MNLLLTPEKTPMCLSTGKPIFFQNLFLITFSFKMWAFLFILNKFSRFSTGPASYFYDAIEEMLANSFIADLSADFDYFVSLSVTNPKVKTQPKGVDVTGLNLGTKEDFWLNKNKTGTTEDFLKMFTKNGKRMNIFRW